MNDPDRAETWISAWNAAQEALAESGAGPDMTRRLTEFGQDYAGFASDLWRLFAGVPTGAAHRPGIEPLQAALAEHYRRLLAPAVPAEVLGTAAAPGIAPAIGRCQRALAVLVLQTTAIAADATRKLVAELSRTDEAPPIATLRELHDLWVECGEEAWSAAVHEDAYADAQAEWLASLVELQFEQRRLAQASVPAGRMP